MSRFVVGVDGGGTRTRAVVVDAEGNELGRAESAGAVVTQADASRAARAVEVAVRAAAESAGVELPAASLWAGLAGAGREEARRAVTALLDLAGLADELTVGTDVEAAFAAAFGVGPGLLLVAGTGSIGLARASDGTVTRVGGWGEHIGDEGSGFWIGREALRCITRAHDGRAPATALTGAILADLGLADASRLITWSASASKAEMAALVPSVVAAAGSGDAAAAGVVRRGVEALVEHVDALIERSPPAEEPRTLALWGGLIWEEGPLRAAVSSAAVERGLKVATGPLDPPVGAARMALLGLPRAPRSDDAPDD